MKKFWSMALAGIMAFSAIFSTNSSIAAADDFWNDYDETWQFEGCNDDYVEFRIPRRNFESLVNKANYKVRKFAGNDVIVEFHREDVKEIMKGRPSKLLTAVKAGCLAIYTAVVGYIVFTLTTNPAFSSNPKVKELMEKNSEFWSPVNDSAINKATEKSYSSSNFISFLFSFFKTEDINATRTGGKNITETENITDVNNATINGTAGISATRTGEKNINATRTGGKNITQQERTEKI